MIVFNRDRKASSVSSRHDCDNGDKLETQHSKAFEQLTWLSVSESLARELVRILHVFRHRVKLRLLRYVYHDR